MNIFTFSDNHKETWRLALSGQRFKFTQRFNWPAKRWFLDLHNEDGSLIAGNIALVHGVDIAAHVNAINERIVIFHKEGKVADPDRGTLSDFYAVFE